MFITFIGVVTEMKCHTWRKTPLKAHTTTTATMMKSSSSSPRRHSSRRKSPFHTVVPKLASLKADIVLGVASTAHFFPPPPLSTVKDGGRGFWITYPKWRASAPFFSSGKFGVSVSFVWVLMPYLKRTLYFLKNWHLLLPMYQKSSNISSLSKPYGAFHQRLLTLIDSFLPGGKKLGAVDNFCCHRAFCY